MKSAQTVGSQGPNHVRTELLSCAVSKIQPRDRGKKLVSPRYRAIRCGKVRTNRASQKCLPVKFKTDRRSGGQS